MTDVHIKIPNPLVKEHSSFTAVAYFRVAGAASAPATNIKYRVDNITRGKQLLDWTSVSVATTVDIAITSAHNAILDNTNRIEKVQLTVAADKGETNATYATIDWNVQNVYGYRDNS